MGNQTQKVEIKKPTTASELKTYLMVVQAKLTLYRNKKVEVIKKKKREIIDSLKQNNLDIAKAKMDSIIREEDLITVYDIVGPLCEILKEKCTYMITNKECPIDLRAHVDTIIYSSTRMEIDDLHTLKDIVAKLYGQLYVTKAVQNNDQLVNVNVVEKLRIKPASDAFIIIRLKQIAKDAQIEFDFPVEVQIPQQQPMDMNMNMGMNTNMPYDPNPYGSQFDNNNGGNNQGFNQYFNQGNQPNMYAQGGLNNIDNQNPYGNVNNNFPMNQQQPNFNPYNQNEGMNFEQGNLPINNPNNPDEPGNSYMNDSPTIQKRDLGK